MQPRQPLQTVTSTPSSPSKPPQFDAFRLRIGLSLPSVVPQAAKKSPICMKLLVFHIFLGPLGHRVNPPVTLIKYGTCLSSVTEIFRGTPSDPLCQGPSVPSQGEALAGDPLTPRSAKRGLRGCTESEGQPSVQPRGGCGGSSEAVKGEASGHRIRRSTVLFGQSCAAVVRLALLLF